MTRTPTPTSEDRRALRRELRARRRAIQGKDREWAARKLARRVAATGWLRPGTRVGLYLSMDEELDTAPLLRLAQTRGCRIALPRITSIRHHRMRFQDYNGMASRGPFGILAPQSGALRSARELDVVFLPLVGFDARGNRIGMGRGFYDRHFAHRLRLVHWRRPLLVGLAYQLQQVDSLPSQVHDVPLDAIVTESSTLRFLRSGT
jgi:5-formyltetrahydrofolate cyclo-ligase